MRTFLSWVAEVKNESTKYECKICYKKNELSNMGIGALKIHLKGPSHEANATKMKNFLSTSRSPSSTQQVH